MQTHCICGHVYVRAVKFCLQTNKFFGICKQVTIHTQSMLRGKNMYLFLFSPTKVLHNSEIHSQLFVNVLSLSVIEIFAQVYASTYELYEYKRHVFILKLHRSMQCIVWLSALLLSVAWADGNCTTWLHPLGDGQCSCGPTLGNVVVCNNETQKVGVLDSYCLTSTEDGSNTSIVGRCLAALYHGERLLSPVGTYVEVLPNITDQDQQTCGYLNRQGQLCGKCQNHHYVSAYSYDIKCHNCTATLWSGVVKYLCIAYLPLTAFLCVVIVFRITVTSPAMNAPVLLCQLFSLPFVQKYSLVQYMHNEKDLNSLKFLATVYGIWSLDFFRLVIPPICLPLDTMHIIALDYLVAVYPLLLLVCVYVLLTAHDRGCRLVVRLWRPFLWCTTRLRQHWNIRNSIIDTFATFLLLSYIKFLNTSFALLTYTKIYNDHGSLVGRYLYYDASIKLMGPQHRPFAILAILVIVVGILFPLLLLLLYPMKWFQKCLNKCNLNSPGLQIFMQCFQGYYRDRTDGGWECRYFAALYPALRVITYAMYSITLGHIFYVGFILLCVIVVVTVFLVQPYKKPYALYNKLDAVLISLVIVFTTCVLGIDIATKHRQIVRKTGTIVAGVVALTPLVYFIFKLLQLLKYVLQNLIIWCHINCNPNRIHYNGLECY